jgi:uncharacterized protein YegL
MDTRLRFRVVVTSAVQAALIVAPGRPAARASAGSRMALAGGSAALTAAILVAVLLGATGLQRMTAAPGAPSAAPEPCSSVVTKTLQPATIRRCEESQVTVGVRPSCPGAPVNIVLIIDEVYKDGWDFPAERTRALTRAVEQLDLERHPNIRVAVVWMYANGASTELDLSNDPRAIIRSLGVPAVSRFYAKHQCFECGYREAVRALSSGAKARDTQEIAVLAAHGVFKPADRPGIVKGAALVKGRGATSITVCFGEPYCVPEFLDAASTPQFHLTKPDAPKLGRLLTDIADRSNAVVLREVILTDAYPESIAVVTDSISPTAKVDPVARRLTWSFTEPITESYTVTYRVKPLQLGNWPMGEGASVSLVDTRSRQATVPVPVPVLAVPEDCPAASTSTPTPTPSPTPPPTATNIPTSIPTLTAVPTPTPSVTPTATPLPTPVFLPLALRESCVPGEKRVDVALVIDASTSMLLLADATHSKLDVAVEAAREFLDLLRLDVGDQAAIVAFNDTAALLAPLTSNRAVLTNALGAPATAQHTCIVCALDVAATELAGDRRRAGNTPVLILLTDGKSNPRPVSEAVTRAAQARQAGVVIFTIGLGTDLDDAALTTIASRPAYCYHAPTAAQLRDIYRQIAVAIPCPAERFWGRG